jgi:TM2 domain-containing membrane protein YozV
MQEDVSMKRCTAADRDAVADILGQHYQAGSLDKEEFSERLDRAMSAKFCADLPALLADLQDLPPQPGQKLPAKALPPASQTPTPQYAQPPRPYALPGQAVPIPAAQAAVMAEGEFSAKAKSTPLTYVLDIFLGALGIHRFYLGSKGSGLAMLLITVLTAGFGLMVTLPWTIVDLFLIPGMVERANDKIRREEFAKYGLLPPSKIAGYGAV